MSPDVFRDVFLILGRFSGVVEYLTPDRSSIALCTQQVLIVEEGFIAESCILS